MEKQPVSSAFPKTLGRMRSKASFAQGLNKNGFNFRARQLMRKCWKEQLHRL